MLHIPASVKRAPAFVGALVAMCMLSAPVARAQTVALNVGSATQVNVLPGATVAIPIEANLAGGGAIAALTSGITWNTLTGGFAFSSLVVGGSAWPIFNANTGGAGGGSVSFATSNNANLPATNSLAIVSFTASVGAIGVERGTRISLGPSAASKVSPAADVLSTLRPRILDVCIAEGKWGDVTNDNAINIIDAQQMARNGIGLSILNAQAMTLRGDVTAGGGNPDIVDAQQTARFSVGLSAAARLGTGTFTTPAVATHTLSPGTTQSLAAGSTLQITNTPRTAGAVDLTGCAGSTWNSSNPAAATVNTSGLVTGVAAGSTVITSTSTINGGVSAQVTVNVTGGNPATQIVVTQQPGGAVAGNAFTTQPIVEVRDASNVLVSSATNQITATLTTGAGTLAGTATATAVNGVATFGGLRIDNAADQKRLTFTPTGGLPTVQSNLFSVTPGNLNTITVNITSPTVALNNSTTATATGFDAFSNNLGAVASPVWSVSNFRVGRVTQAGAIQGIGSGTSNIIATSGAISGQSGLTVNAAAGNFTITMENIVDLSSKPTIQAAFNTAAARWASIIRGELPNFNFNQSVAACTGVPGKTLTTLIDDIYIFVNITTIDGPGLVLGSAGPCFASSGYPIVGNMKFDVEDLDNLSAAQLNAVIMHEMGHVLGIGTLWGTVSSPFSGRSLLIDEMPSASNDPIFVGTNGIWAFENMGTGYVGRSVPVENCIGIAGCGAGTINGHWREGVSPNFVLNRELMTGYIEGGDPMPLSPLTAASLIDMTYQADVNQADNPPYFLYGPRKNLNVFDLIKLPLREVRMPAPIDLTPRGRPAAPIRTDTVTIRRR